MSIKNYGLSVSEKYFFGKVSDKVNFKDEP